jgi:hypothetical protein
MAETTFIFATCSDAPPAYGKTVEDITRPGATVRKFRVTGAGASSATLSGTIYCADWSTATALCNSLNAEKGNIVGIQDLSRDLSYRAMLMDVTASPKKIRAHSLNPAINGALAMVTANLTIERIA